MVSFCSSHRLTPNCHPRLKSKVNLHTLFYWLSYLPPKQILSHKNLCTSSIEDTKHCVQIRGSYLKQKVRYWYLEKCRSIEDTKHCVQI